MGKTSNGTFRVPGGFEVNNNKPVDDRFVVETDADLLVDTNEDGTLKTIELYKGLIVYSEESETHYVWNGLDRTNVENWLTFGVGGSAGIPLSYKITNANVLYFEGAGTGNPLNAFGLVIQPNELNYIKLEVLSTSNVLSRNTYLVPLQAGDYPLLGQSIAFGDLLLIEKENIGFNLNSANTITIVRSDLNQINASDPSLDLSDPDIVYFFDLDDGFYRFVGTNGLYGANDLTMLDSDLEEIFSFSTDKNYVYQSNTPTTSWTINHGLQKGVSVTILDDTDSEVIARVVHVNLNTVRIEFNDPFVGKAHIN